MPPQLTRSAQDIWKLMCVVSGANMYRDVTAAFGDNAVGAL